MTDAPLLYAEKLYKRYSSQARAAVEDISFSLHAGKILALLGPNGAGKTTTIKMVAGLITPSAGRTVIRGYDVERRRSQAVQHLGAVLEGARNLYWRLSAQENLLYFGSLRMVSRPVLGQRIEELLNLFELQEVRHHEVRHFSRGMQQKLAIAAALLHNPDVLLLDEPTLGLDVQAARTVEKTVRDLADRQGRAVLLTTHVMPLAERLADDILVIHKGRKVAYGSTDSILGQHNTSQDVIEIRVLGGLPSGLHTQITERYPGLSIQEQIDQTLLSLSASQSRIINLLQLLDNANLQITNVGRRGATLEEIFLSLIGD